MQPLQNHSPPLRPYQQDVLDKMIAYNGRAALCVLATGLGKTRIFSKFLRHEALDNGHTCLILSHREELVTQPLAYLGGIPCGVEQGKRRADTGDFSGTDLPMTETILIARPVTHTNVGLYAQMVGRGLP